MYENSARLGGAIYADGGSSASVINCTLAFNSATEYGIILPFDTSQLVIENTIISHSVSGEAIYPLGEITLSCCNIFGNAGGDWLYVEDQLGIRGNISEDPLYCDPDARDLTLQDCSPCRPYSPPNPECDLIGAWPVGCGPTAVRMHTWGAIKAMYRR